MFVWGGGDDRGLRLREQKWRRKEREGGEIYRAKRRSTCSQWP